MKIKLYFDKNFDPETDPLFKKTGDTVLDYVIKSFIFSIIPYNIIICIILYFMSVFYFDLSYFSLHFLWLFIVFVLIANSILFLSEMFGFISFMIYKSEQYKYTETLKKQ